MATTDIAVIPTHRQDGYDHGIAPWADDPTGRPGRWQGWLRRAGDEAAEWERNHGFVGVREALVRRSASELLWRGGEALSDEVSAALEALRDEEDARRLADDRRREAEAAARRIRDARRLALDAEARAATFSRREISLAMPGGGRRRVRALALGRGLEMLAVHRADGAAGFDVTHEASGRRVLRAPTQSMARVAAVRLAGLADWARPIEEIKATPGLRAASKALEADAYAEIPARGAE